MVFGFILAICYSCSELEDFLIDSTSVVSWTTMTRAAGDEKFDVVGYGYDVTNEYLHPLSVKGPVLNVEKYKQDHSGRLESGTASYGHDRMYYGYSSADYVKNITTETKATYTMSYGNEKDTVFFSNTITNNAYLKTEYSYSSKYSFASLDLVRNLKHIYFNDEISRLSQYLSDSFKEDLERLSPNRIVERYGTHVLTDIIIGGRYKLIFRSVITKARDASTKRRTVSSGFKSTLDGIGVSYNLEHIDTVDESLVKDNQHKELYVMFYGGSGTNLKYDLEKGMPTSVDVLSWEKSLSLANSCLTEINWKETYPIYEFISDPVKKQVLKAAVIKHIEKSKIDMLELLPLHIYVYDNPNEVNQKRMDHYTTTQVDIEKKYSGWKYGGVEGYVVKKRYDGTVPFYEYYSDNSFDHYTTTISTINQDFPGWKLLPESISGYIYKDIGDNLIPLYEYYNDDLINHYTSTDPTVSQIYDGWHFLPKSISGYVYPAN